MTLRAVGKEIADVVETAGELEWAAEPEDVSELLQVHAKILTDKQGVAP